VTYRIEEQQQIATVKMQRLELPLLASLLLLLLPGILTLSQQVSTAEVKIVHYQPEQVHLAFGGECFIAFGIM